MMTEEQQKQAIQLLREARQTLGDMHCYETDIYHEIYEFLEEVSE